MKILEDRIIKDGRVLPGNVLKVDSFLNHMIDVPFVYELGKEFRRLFETSGVTKILTIEASGIGLACLTAQYFGVPVVFAKKSRTSNISSEVYSTPVESYTHGNTNNVIVSKQYLGAGDRVLIIDDFLATGNALKGLIELCRLAGADVVGCGIAIEKRYQHGGDALRAENIRVESLALIDSMENGNIVFSQI